MTFEELNKILCDDAVKISVDELKDVVYRLFSDCFVEINRCYSSYDSLPLSDISFYSGKQSAFYIVLSLLDHLK